MRKFRAVFNRELIGLFSTPTIYFYVFCLVSINVLFAFNIGQLFEINEANLVSYFQFHPWLFMVFVPALGLRAFCDDNRTGLSELLLSLPVSSYSIVLAKFIALLIVCGLSILFCIPLWIWVSFLGTIDNGIVISSMIASMILASSILSISVFVSVHNKSQTLSFVISAGISLIIIGSSMPFLISGIESLGDFGHFFAQILSLLAMYDGYESAINGNLRFDWLSLNLFTIAFFLYLSIRGFEANRKGRL